MSSGQFGSVASNCTKTLQSCCTWILRSRNSQENLWKLRCLAPKDVRRSLHFHLCYITYIYISYHIITINQIYCVCCQPWIHKPQTAVLNGGGVPGTVVDRCRKLLTDIRKDLPSDSVKQIQEPFWCGASDVGDDALIIEFCVCIYICMCMYICTYICICVFIYIYTHNHLEWWDWSSLVEHWSICVGSHDLCFGCILRA